MRDENGACPTCGAAGNVGTPCAVRVCNGLGMHYLPEAYAARVAAANPASRDPIIGCKIDDYLVVDVIGEGGFGRVYLALQTPILMKAALKLMTARGRKPEETRAMLHKFEGEAAALASLSDPNVVRLLKYGMFGDAPYLVMEYVEGGRTLKSEVNALAVRGEGIDMPVVRRMLEQVLGALESAHGAGIVHRDLKPENIMLQKVRSDPWFVKVVDFGLAKFLEHGSDTVLALGTPQYMAPEQVTRQGIGPWTDLYAVGVIAFELMTGRRPFPGRTNQEILAKKLDPRYDVAGRLSDLDCPDFVPDFFRRALARDPSERFRRTEEFKGAMDRLFRALEDTKEVSICSGDLGDLVDSSALAAERKRLEDERRAYEEQQRRLEEERQAFEEVRRRVEAENAARVKLEEERRAIEEERQRIAAEKVGLEEERRRAAGPIMENPVTPGHTSPPVDTRPAVDAHREARTRRGWVMPVATAVIAVIGLGVYLISRPGLGPDEAPPDAPGGEVARASDDPGLMVEPRPSDRDLPLRPPPAGMVAIPPGEYPIGCQPDDRSCLDDEKPGRAVALPAFGIMSREVTMEDYDECVAKGACPKPGKGGLCTWQRDGLEKDPINCVDWKAASAYCAWKDWRLPTEAEWEAAARGPSHLDYPWGNEPPSCRKTLMAGAGGPGCGTGKTLPAKSRSSDRSWSGASDLGGSVREWVTDVYAAYPGGRTIPGMEGRVNRGGSFEMTLDQMPTSHTRNADAADERRPDLGFRCAVSLSGM